MMIKKRWFTSTVSGSISASTPACHAGERGSTPRQRDFFLLFALQPPEGSKFQTNI